MPDLTLLQFQSHNLSVLKDAHKPWWIAAEICAILELKNVSQAVSRLREDEKEHIKISDTVHQELKTLIINEAGLYRLVMGSRKKSAEAFQYWVLQEKDSRRKAVPALRRLPHDHFPHRLGCDALACQ